jgi:predicted phosphodiesterase
MRLLAISDLHVGYRANRAALEALPAHPDDWLILAGDIGETEAHLEHTLALLAPRFRRLVWCPGNHDLWTVRDGDARGLAKYERLISICRRWSVLTPEDEYAVFDGHGERFLIAPLFLLYDYTFRPDHVPAERAVDWAVESGVLCADEELLHPHPFETRAAWCQERCRVTEQRLERAVHATGLRTILVNHFPLKQCLASLPAIPRFQIWCGTRTTEDWHQRFRAAVVVSGHLHIRKTTHVDSTRFEEVSLGYPERQWRVERGLAGYLREILPGVPSHGSAGG